MSGVVGRNELLDLLTKGWMIITSSGIYFSASVMDREGLHPSRTVRSDTFWKLRDGGFLVELPKYERQPLSVNRYILAKKK